MNFIGGAVAVVACLSGMPASATNFDDVCYAQDGADPLVLRLTVEYLGQLSATGETPVQRTYSVAGLSKLNRKILPLDGSITVARGLAAQMVLTEGPRLENNILAASTFGCIGGPSPVPASWTCVVVDTDGNGSQNITINRVKPSSSNPACRVFAPS
jgi:hypothetical protein